MTNDTATTAPQQSTDPLARVEQAEELLSAAVAKKIAPVDVVAKMEQAADLLARHSAWGVHAESTHHAPEERYFIKTEEVEITGTYPRQRVFLLCAVAESVGCRALIEQKTNGQSEAFEVEVTGGVLDVERALLLYPRLLTIGLSGAQVASVPADQGVKAYRRGWLLGFAAQAALRLRCIEAYVQDEVTEQGTDPDAVAIGHGPHPQLPVDEAMRTRSTQVDAGYAESHPEAEGEPVLSTENAPGFVDGLNYGRTAPALSDDIGDTATQASESVPSEETSSEDPESTGTTEVASDQSPAQDNSAAPGAGEEVTSALTSSTPKPTSTSD